MFDKPTFIYEIIVFFMFTKKVINDRIYNVML